MRAIFERDLKESELITLEMWRARPIADRIRETGAATLSELL
jgi:hypothetical protein